ncbi:hypothetical protein TRIATDRAFT_258227 [Trichoderma atroviride IMI 206040]|uniref:Uncharacterized protein n=1 Tax=Hypocrea atroviridis (strain ATCC 20476 / IMI 206040) TaxID=452589 RepID=G9P3B1_HYPAI|nr:uncharacterized protein TRIATDRAFT_258227 [Trichoderma atroviride IMI 206040]EHK42872.1 hypothetical protein TRIATDRAFT_258227 [Trichoderma atroviride IMI 206040]
MNPSPSATHRLRPSSPAPQPGTPKLPSVCYCTGRKGQKRPDQPVLFASVLAYFE